MTLYGQVVPLQVPLTQAGPVVQHGSPESPHDVHWLWEPTVWHTVWVAVHWLPEQHGRPTLPHDWQTLLDVHTRAMPTMAHAEPVATQVPALVPVLLASLSQQPLWHWAPGQHGCPVPPQAWQLVPEQTDLPPAHCSPS
jgi:hypothetical protein